MVGNEIKTDSIGSQDKVLVVSSDMKLIIYCHDSKTVPIQYFYLSSVTLPDQQFSVAQR